MVADPENESYSLNYIKKIFSLESEIKLLRSENSRLKQELALRDIPEIKIDLQDPEILMTQENEFYENIIRELSKEVLKLNPLRRSNSRI